MTIDALFERMSKVLTGEASAGTGCNELNPCPPWFRRLELPDRLALTMINSFLVAEMHFSRADYGDLTPEAEKDPIQTRYREWRPIRPKLGSYYSNHWYLEWISAETGTAFQLHLLTAPRDSNIWIYAQFDLDIYLTWGGQRLDGEDCHFISPGLSHWRAVVDHISIVESAALAV
jgi:hypothetical protein